MDKQLSGSVSACEEEVLACVRLNSSITQIINWRELKLDDIYPCMLCDNHWNHTMSLLSTLTEK